MFLKVMHQLFVTGQLLYRINAYSNIFPVADVIKVLKRSMNAIDIQKGGADSLVVEHQLHNSGTRFQLQVRVSR